MYPTMRLVHLMYLFRIPMYPYAFGSDTCQVPLSYPNMYPLCVGSPQVPLSYTQICRCGENHILCVWFTSDTSPIPKYVNMYPNMYLCVWFTSGTSFVYPNMYPYAFGSPQVPLSYTQICTPMRLVHLKYLFRIPKYVPPMRWFTSGTSFVYPNMYILCVWFTSETSRIPKYVPPMRLVHLRYLFRIPKHVPPMRLVHLRYLFRIPKYVPPMRLVHLRYLFRIPKYVMRLVR